MRSAQYSAEQAFSLMEEAAQAGSLQAMSYLAGIYAGDIAGEGIKRIAARKNSAGGSPIDNGGKVFYNNLYIF